MADKIEQIRARSAGGSFDRDKLPREHRLAADIATLLSHIDALNRAIAAHKRDEDQRSRMEAAAFENGRRNMMDKLRAVLTPEVVAELDQSCASTLESLRAAWNKSAPHRERISRIEKSRDALREARRLLHD